MNIFPIGIVKDRGSFDKEIRIYNEYADGLQGIDRHNYFWILFWMNRLAEKDWLALLLHPQGNRLKKKQGVFSLHSPSRPNPIGLTKVKLLKRVGNVLYVQGLDAFDGTPVIDIKPAKGGDDGRE